MNAELQKAIDSLQVSDIYLRSSTAISSDDFDPKYSFDLASASVQKMHVVKSSEVVAIEDDGQLLRVFLILGARWIEPIKDTDDLKVFTQIEAEFVAEYKMLSELSQESIDAFCNMNASYHIWPYWREFLASQSERMRLPRLIMPATQLPHHRHENSDEKT